MAPKGHSRLSFWESWLPLSMTYSPPGCGRALVFSRLQPVPVAATILSLIVLHSIFIVQSRSIRLLLPRDLNAANTRRQHRRVVCDIDLPAIGCNGTDIYEPRHMKNDVLRLLREIVV